MGNSSESQAITVDELTRRIGAQAPWSDWVCVDQARIDGFAEVTGDDAFIHVDPVRAARTRFKGTIAHGLLILTLLPKLLRTAVPPIAGKRMGVNYGFERVRFIAPVPVGSRVRARFVVADVVESKPKFFVLTYNVTVEMEQSAQPALAATWMLGFWID